MFGAVFPFSHLKTMRFFGFGVSHGLPVFSSFVFGFRFSSTIIAVYRTFLSGAFYGFSGFAKEVTPRSRAETGVIPRDHLFSVKTEGCFFPK